MSSINEESRQWIWVFRALWSVAPKLAEVVIQQHQHSTLGRARCRLHLLVPDTVFFQRGEPCKWVGSSPQGIVVRKPFLQAPSDESISMSSSGAGEALLSERRHTDLASRLAARSQASSSSRAMDDFEVFERLDIIVAAFLAFAASALSPSSGSDAETDAPVCVARYNDGTTELLSSKSLKTLCRFFNWRASLCALQAYVRPAHGATPMATTTIGTYSRKREGRNKTPQHGRPQRSNAKIRAWSRASSASCAKDDKARVGDELSLRASSSTTAATSDLQPAEGPLAVAPDDDSSSSPSLQPLKTALNQATEDVAFVTDMSYAWPAEPSRATPRRGHSIVPPKDISSLGKEDIARRGDKELGDDRMAVVVGGSAGTFRRRRPPWPKSRVRVSHLEAEFIIDQDGRPWFTNAPKVLVQSVRRPPNKEADEHKQQLKRKRLAEEATHASSGAARELRAVVTLASRRGLNAEEIFQHFVVDGAADRRAREATPGCRCAGKEDVIKGMEGLGISLSEEAAALLIETIVRSSGEPPRQHSTQRAADAGQLRGNVNQPLRVPKERRHAAIAGGSEIPEPRRAREPSLQRSPAGRKSSPPLFRQHITADDLWNFARRRSAQGCIAQSSSEDAGTVHQGEEGLASADDESHLDRSRDEGNEGAANHGEAGQSSMRKRARSIGSTRGGGSAKQTVSNDISFEEAPSSIGSTGPQRPVPASLLMMSSFSAAGNAVTAATPGAAASTAPNGLEATAGEGEPRPPYIPAQVGSVDPRRKKGLPPRRRRTFPAGGGSVAVASAAAAKVSHEKVEVASFPCDNPALEAMDGRDRVFHVERGLVIAYRLLRHQTEPNPHHQQTDVIGDSDAGGTASAAAEASRTNKAGPSLMVVVPGLFQTLDTIERAMLPLLEAHPKLVVLLVAPPGLPNTHWPATVSLNGELTAKCVSSLLEHLLDGDELLAKHDGDDAITSPNTNPVEPEKEHCTALPPSTITPHALPPEPVPELPPPSEPERGAVEANHGVALSERDNIPEDASLSAPAAPPSPSDICPTSPRATPTILVGFGTGANSLLHLAAAPNRQEGSEDLGGGSGGDWEGDRGDCVGVELNEAEGGSDTGSGVAADSGLLTSLLCRKGFRVGGLILVNGFVSLEEQSTQVVRTLRQAFCDQSDGRARAEGVASLLLSERYLAAVTVEPTTTVAASTTKSFLETREAFCLSANVSAHVYPQTQEYSSPGRAKLVPSRTRNSSPPNHSPESTNFANLEAKVSVDSVLREMEETDQKRKRQLLRWQQRHRRRRRRGDPASRSFRRQQRHSGTDTDGADADNGLLDEEHSLGDLDNDDEVELRHTTADGRWPPSPQWSKPSTGSSHESRNERGSSNATVTGPRLALAASVSTLSGLLGRSRTQGVNGSGAGDTTSSRQLGDESYSAGDNNPPPPTITRSGIPIVMVQSTEDALIGSPLALVLKSQLCPEELVDTEAGSVLECFNPSPTRVPLKDGGHIEHAPSYSESSPSEEDIVEEKVEDTGGNGGERERDDGRGHSVDDDDRKRMGGRGGGRPVTHTCWVKAGHDLLHEREPFLRALLHKAIYACHGREAPQTGFLDRTGCHGTEKTKNDGIGPNESQSRGGDGEKPQPPSPGPQNGEVGAGGIIGVEPELRHLVNDDDPDSQLSRDRFYRRGEARRRGVPATGNATTAGGTGSSDDGAVVDAAANNISGTPPRELELDNSIFWHDPASPSTGSGVADGSVSSSGDGKAPERSNFPSRVRPAVGTGSSTAGSSSLSVATSALMGDAPKLVDFFEMHDEGSSRRFRAARQYLEEFRELNLDRAILERGLGATGERMATLDVPLMSRYTFQTMKDCWRCRILVVEAVRLDLGMRKKQALTREQLALSIRAVNNMVRTLRKSGKHGTVPASGNNEGDDNSVMNSMLQLDPLDQRALKVDIAAAEVTRGKLFIACRRLRRTGTVLSTRRKRLESTLAFLTEGVRGTLLTLERIMGQLRKQLALARIQERVFQEEVVKADRKGLKARRRLVVVKEQLVNIEQHPHKWTDSDAWQPGYVQRLETAELVKMLTKEGCNLQSVADDANEQSDRARELHGEVSRQEADLAATMEGVGALFSLLNSALEDETFTKDPEAAVEMQTRLEKEASGHGDGSGGTMRRRRRILQSLAARVRATSHRNRTPDEKRWVALDAVLNPGLYHHVTLAEAEEMRWDALYYTKLDREDLDRVLSLPSQVQLALPFLHTPDEVAAHELLARYTHGINADHFARLDQCSQDVAKGILPIPLPSSASAGGSSAATPSTGSHMPGDGAPTPDGPANGAGNDAVVGATRRVLACMQRAAEASLKLPAEREDEEAVWCVLDKKLRPDLYRDSDEAAADRAEELHQEADAREDARHTWLATPGDTPKTRGTTTVAGVAGTGGAPTMGSVVKQRSKAKQADEAAAEQKVAEEREALVVGATNAFTKNDIEALVAAGAGEPLWGSELGQEREHVKKATAAREEPTRRHEIGRGCAQTSTGATDDREVESFAVVTTPRELETHADSTSPRHDDQRSRPDDDNYDDKASAEMNGSRQQQAEERRRLAETVKTVLPRFFVAEEETPLGRDMVRSLAMLQEVTLRLGEGQRNVFSGLNPQSALAIVRSRWQQSTTTPPTAEDHGTAVAANIGAPGERREGTRAVLGEEVAAYCNREEETAYKEATATPPPKGAAEPATRVEADKLKANSADTEQRLVDETKSTSETGSRRDNGGSADGGSVANRGGGSMLTEARKLEKVFGSWEEIHPAALGISSQETAYFVGEGKEAHPASFRVPSEADSIGSSALSSSLTSSGAAPHHAKHRHRADGSTLSSILDPLDVLTGEGLSGAAVTGWPSYETSGESTLVASGMAKVGELDPGEVRRRGLLVASRERTRLLDVETSELQAGQSKAFAFRVGPYATGSDNGSVGSDNGSVGSSTDKGLDKLDARSKPAGGEESSTGSAGPPTETAKVVLGLAVTVIFQGNFEKEGYRLGRLAAGLYRMPPSFGEGGAEGDSAELPQPVGFAPYSLQSLNTPESIGRVMIFHQPRVQPVREGQFQVVIGAASRVRYSVSVVASTAADALTSFEESVKAAKRMQKRLPKLLEGMAGLKDTRKLTRWKQRIVREMLEEAREEAVRCDGEVSEAKREIQEEENDQKLDDEGRRAVLTEARDLNVELAHWKTVFASRVQEGKDLREGLESIKAKLKTMREEEDDLREKLAQARQVLPAAAFVLKTQREATDIALELNATVDIFSGATARWAAADVLKERGEVVLSPADRVRRALKDDGWEVLTLEEKRFTMLDRVLRPDLYLWMKGSYLNEEGVALLAPEVPVPSQRRKDSLVQLIGADAIGSKSLDSVENVEEAMQTKKVQGWSNKAKSFATPTAWTGKGKIAPDTTGGDGSAAGTARGVLTARSDATSAGALTARPGTGRIARLTLADEWRLRDFSFTAMELERIKATPFHRLQRTELKARKLLGRFHEENEDDGGQSISTEQPMAAAERRCARVRAKDAAARTGEENEWVEIDKKIYPDIWQQKYRQEDRLKRFNMTLASLPKPSAGGGLGEDDDSNEESDERDDGIISDAGGGGNGSSSERKIGGRHGGLSGSRRRNRTPAECPFDREEILQIWSRGEKGTEKGTKAQKHRKRGEDRIADREEDKRRVRELLLAFNGPFSTFAKEEARRRCSRRIVDGGPLTMSTSRRIVHAAAEQSRTAAAYARENSNLGRPGSARGPGPDAKMIALLRELITAKTINSKYMDSKVAHGTAQRFNTEHYAKELERDLASQLREQILERERAVVHDTKDTANEEASDIESSDDEHENWETGDPQDGTFAKKGLTARTRPREQGGSSGLHTSPTKAKIGKIGQGAPQTAHLLPSAPAASEVGSRFGATAKTLSAPKYGVGGGGNEEEEGPNSNWHDMPVVQEFTEEEVEDLVREDPAWEGCRACLTLPCRWCSCVDYRSIDARKSQIRDELFRLMGMWDEDEVFTAVPLSCVRGGPTTLRRTEAIRELRWEAKELDHQLHLAAVDKELHEAYNTTREAIEVKSLHAYSALLWTKDAQGALSKERDLTLARTTAQEVVDDLLESMLDGWVFGERQAEHAAGGIIPAVKTSGPLRPGDQRRAVAYLEHRHRLRRIAHAKGERLPEEVKGTPHTKALPIDDLAQQRILEGRASKKKGDQKHLLRETENTMKFGLFSMVQGYLHAMTLVKREKEAWSGKGDQMTKEGSGHRPPLTSERKRMVQEAVKARERAASRRNFLDRAQKAEARGELRDAQQKRRTSQRNAMRVLEIKARDKAARNIQRVFRGFRGKVFAQRWALKRAEIEALKSVLHEATVNVQRAYRGHLGRVEASEVRMELAEYIADIRVKEAESDIADFWKTHKLKATKDELKKTLLKTIGKPLVAMRRRKLE